MSRNISVLLYIGVFIFSSFMIRVSVNKQNSTKKFFLFLGMLLPTLLASFRSVNVGVDTQTYYSIFRNYSTIQSLNGKLELQGFNEFINTLLMHISSKIGNYNLYMFIFSIATLWLIVKSIVLYVPSTYAPLSYFIYLCIFFPLNLNIMRQGLSIAIFFFSLQYIYDRKPLRYFMLAFIAIGIHISATITIPLYFLIKNNRKINYLFFIVFSSIIFFLLLNPIMLFDTLSNFPGFERYSFYSVYEGNINNRIVIINIAIFLIMLLYEKNLLPSIYEKKDSLLFYILFIGVIIGLTGFISPYIKRLSNYFDIVQIIILTRVPMPFKRKYDFALVQYICYLFGVFYFFIAYYWLNLAGIMTYSIQFYK